MVWGSGTLVELTIYGRAHRSLHIKLPVDLHQLGTIGDLLKTMYGTRDAASTWMETWAAHLKAKGFSSGKANPSFFRFCHGDDFCAIGAKNHFEAFEKILQEAYDIKRVGIIAL